MCPDHICHVSFLFFNPLAPQTMCYCMLLQSHLFQHKYSSLQCTDRALDTAAPRIFEACWKSLQACTILCHVADQPRGHVDQQARGSPATDKNGSFLVENHLNLKFSQNGPCSNRRSLPLQACGCHNGENSADLLA